MSNWNRERPSGESNIIKGRWPPSFWNENELRSLFLAGGGARVLETGIINSLQSENFHIRYYLYVYRYTYSPPITRNSYSAVSIQHHPISSFRTAYE